MYAIATYKKISISKFTTKTLCIDRCKLTSNKKLYKICYEKVFVKPIGKTVK